MYTKIWIDYASMQYSQENFKNDVVMCPVGNRIKKMFEKNKNKNRIE